MQPYAPPSQHQRWKPAHSWPAFTLLLLWQIWLAHALAFFSHEYAHSTLAWLLGWKTNPLALNYGHLTLANFLAQFSIDENVDYLPIFASGHAPQAGMIAAAGVVIGNFLLTFPLSLWALRAAVHRGSRTWAMLAYWVCVGSVGNLIDYVPMRTFSFREDMHTTAQGFHCSPWWILLVLGTPFAIALVYFFWRVQPSALLWLLPASPARRGIVAFLTAFAVFGFYGAAGWSNSGLASHWLSVISVYALVPLMTFVGWLLTDKSTSGKASA